MASITVPTPKIAPLVRVRSNLQTFNNQKIQLTFGSSIRQSSLSLSQLPRREGAAVCKVRAQLNEVAVEKSSNSVPVVDTASQNGSLKGRDESKEKRIPDAVSISEFMAQVSELIDIVDSRDVVELHLKQTDSEILIRKKEAFAPPPPPPPVVTMQQPFPQPTFSTPAPAAAAPARSPSPASASPALPAPSKSSHPPLKSPMAGNFYRCPGPGEPPFVKVGDVVQKGQVLCIIEAMKLMNEIEADKSGTIAEILLEDGKPVSAGTPLFVIAP